MTDYPRPVVADAPGIVWKKRKSGWEARWQARSDLLQRGFLPQYVRLWIGAAPTEIEANYISDMCQRLQGDMLVWGRGDVQKIGRYNGTIATLIDCYLTDRVSSFQKLRYRTRENYLCLCRRIDKEHGADQLRNIRARHILAWHQDWIASGHVSMAHSLMGMLRMLVGFGLTILEDRECERLAGVLSNLRFPMARPRIAILTADHVLAIRAEAHRRGLHSMALAQAIQFECMLRQKDVVGEFVPLNEPGVSEVISGNDKWLRGIRWEEIDDDLILRHTTSKRNKDVEIDLKLAPMVMEELERIPNREKGPVIVYEITGLPYVTHQFRRLWREIATAARVPKSIRNMDSRAGAITEATQSGADLEHIRHAATHGDISMTQRYARGAAEKTAIVMRMRVEGRNKKGTPAPERKVKATD